MDVAAELAVVRFRVPHSPRISASPSAIRVSLFPFLFPEFVTDSLVCRSAVKPRVWDLHEPSSMDSYGASVCCRHKCSAVHTAASGFTSVLTSIGPFSSTSAFQNLIDMISIRTLLLHFPALLCSSFIIGCQRVLSAEIVGTLACCGSSRSYAKMQPLIAPEQQAVVLGSFLCLSAVLSMAETTITALWPWKVREFATAEQGTGVFQMLHSDANRFMMTILIGKTIFNIGATILVTRAARRLFGGAGVGIAASFMIITILLITEITPKCIAVNYAQEVARFVVTPVAWLSWFLYPIGNIANFISVGILRVLSVNGKSNSNTVKHVSKLRVQRVELCQKIKEQEKNMIKNVLEMKGTIVREVMTPLIDVVALDAGSKLIDFKKLWASRKCSRIPVFEHLIGNIIGIAYVKDLVNYINEVEIMYNSSVGEIARKPVYFVPDSMSIKDLLREFRLRRVHMGVVVDGNSETAGIVTMDDVMQKIFGDLNDNNLKVKIDIGLGSAAFTG